MILPEPLQQWALEVDACPVGQDIRVRGCEAARLMSLQVGWQTSCGACTTPVSVRGCWGCSECGVAVCLTCRDKSPATYRWCDDFLSYDFLSYIVSVLHWYTHSCSLVGWVRLGPPPPPSLGHPPFHPFPHPFPLSNLLDLVGGQSREGWLGLDFILQQPPTHSPLGHLSLGLCSPPSIPLHSPNPQPHEHERWKGESRPGDGRPSWGRRWRWWRSRC